MMRAESEFVNLSHLIKDDTHDDWTCSFVKWLDENMMYIPICDVLWEAVSWYVFSALCLHFPLRNLCRFPILALGIGRVLMMLV